MKPLVFRSTPSFVFAWVWMVFAAANLVDLAVRGRDVTAVIAASTLLLGAGLAYVIGLRPRVVADETSVRLRNPLRDVRLPWSVVDKVETTDAIEISSGDRTFRAYALQISPRARARAQARPRRGSGLPDSVAEHVRGRLPIDFAAEQLNELATQNRRDDPNATPVVSLSWFAVGTLALPAAVLAVSILIAVLS
jgi:hypothetical protein